MRFYKKVSIALFIPVLILMFGPKPSKPNYDVGLPIVPTNAIDLEKYVLQLESQHHIKPNNEARIVWENDSTKQVTDYAIVYLHGFSASQEEGNPVHRNIAKKFGCNLYLARLAEHGIDTSEALINMTADNLWESAKQAYAIGKQLGKKVILMSTSTGGTLALKLAAEYPEIAGNILYSPNIAIKDNNAWLLNNSWGLQMARLVKGSKYNVVKTDTNIYKNYWNDIYRLEATTELEQLLETTMIKSVFTKIHQPTLALYYYKDEDHQDNVVSTKAIKNMMMQINTAPEQKKCIALPNVGNHVLASPILSKDIVSVEKETTKFLKEVVGLKVKQ
jgi:esterase/lipase